MLQTLWTDFIAPMFRRPPRYQVAALCWRHEAGVAQVLLITSLDTGRWILPKGWPKDGSDSAGIALQEAWEEAGITPTGTPPRKVGRYRYAKRLRGGVPVATDVDVFAIEAQALDDAYPEAHQRQRRWMTGAEAAEAVHEPQLKALLSRLPQIVGSPPTR